MAFNIISINDTGVWHLCCSSEDVGSLWGHESFTQKSVCGLYHSVWTATQEGEKQISNLSLKTWCVNIDVLKQTFASADVIRQKMFFDCLTQMSTKTNICFSRLVKPNATFFLRYPADLIKIYTSSCCMRSSYYRLWKCAVYIKRKTFT